MKLKLRAAPLPEEVTKFLQENEKQLKDFRECKRYIYCHNNNVFSKN
jgi:hypothetical protein